jgi:hypothetical protein
MASRWLWVIVPRQHCKAFSREPQARGARSIFAWVSAGPRWGPLACGSRLNEEYERMQWLNRLLEKSIAGAF